jgi:hypothetical protein
MSLGPTHSRVTIQSRYDLSRARMGLNLANVFGCATVLMHRRRIGGREHVRLASIGHAGRQKFARRASLSRIATIAALERSYWQSTTFGTSTK